MGVSRPNILIIHADQHRWDCLGAYGNKDIKTPFIDSLAQDGVLYRNCFTTYPVCTPSRYSLLTGLYANQHTGSSNHCTIPQGLDTFPRLLSQAGYRTKAVGKMHFTPTYLDVGFQEMVLAEQDGPGRHDDDYHRYLRQNELSDCLDLIDQVWEYRDQGPSEYHKSFSTWPSDLDDEHYSTTWIADRAVESLGSWTDEGNLLMVGFIKPHHPFDAPAPWGDMYDPSSLSLLPGWTDSCLARDLETNKGYYPHSDLTPELCQRTMAQYYGSISQIDYHVGRMMDHLKAKGLYDNTLIVYTSDHGEYMGFHHLILKAGSMYDPLVRLPLIIKYPGQDRAGEVSESLVSNIDMAPTLLSQGGCSPSRQMKGLDLGSSDVGRHLVYCMGGIGDEYMVRSKTRKLLLRKDGKSLFFDLESDPFEMFNLYADPNYQGEVEEYKQILYNWALFDAVTPAWVDNDAPVVDSVSKSCHRESESYYRKKVQEYIKEIK